MIPRQPHFTLRKTQIAHYRHRLHEPPPRITHQTVGKSTVGKSNDNPPWELEQVIP